MCIYIYIYERCQNRQGQFFMSRRNSNLKQKGKNVKDFALGDPKYNTLRFKYMGDI